MISHRNVIANVLQHTTFESVGRRYRGVDVQNVAGFLPFSHIYGLIVVAHTCTFRGDGIIVLPKFDFLPFLAAVQRYRINQLILVCYFSDFWCWGVSCEVWGMGYEV